MKSYLVKNNVIKLTFILVFLSLAIINCNSFSDEFNHPKEISLSLVGFIILNILLLEIVCKKKVIFQFRTTDYLFISTLFYIIISNIVSIQLNNIVLIASLCIIYIYVRFIFSKSNYKDYINNILISFGILALVEILIVFYDVVNNGLYFDNSVNYTKPLILGSFGNVNLVSLFFASGLPILIFHWYKSRPILRLFWSFLIGMSVFFIVLTESRAAWISIVISFLLVILYYLSTMSVRIKNTMILLFISFVIIILMIEPLINMNRKSVEGRLQIWNTSLQIINDNLIFGIGFENFNKVFMESQANKYDEKHFYYINENNIFTKKTFNEIIAVIVKYGLVGFILISLFFGLCARNVLKFFSVTSTDKKYFLPSCFTVLILLFYSMFDNPFQNIWFLIFSIIHMGIILGLIDQNRILIYPIISRSSSLFKNYIVKYEKIILVAAIIFNLIYINIIIKNTRCYIYWGKAKNLITNHQYSRAFYYCEAALGIQPDIGELHFYKGICEFNKQDYKKAILSFMNAKNNWEDKNIYINLTYSFFRLQKYELAKKLILEMKRKYSNLLSPYYLLGILYKNTGQIKRSIKCFEFLVNAKLNYRSYDENEIKKNSENQLRVLKKLQNLR